MNHKQLTRRVTTRGAIIASLVVIIVGIVTIAAPPLLKLPDWAATTLSQVGGVLIATGVISIYWDVKGRRELLDELKTIVDQNSAARELGLLDWSKHYLEDRLWPDLKNATSIDFCSVYAAQWRRRHMPALRAAASKGAVIRIVVPDPDDVSLMRSIATRIGMNADDLTKKVQSAIEEFSDISPQNNGSVKVFKLKHALNYSMYRVDDRLIVTPSPNFPAKVSNSPAIVVARGTAQFFSDDLESVISRATLHQPTQSRQLGGLVDPNRDSQQ
ncbi:hypothetical protein [Enemella evansiae]|uniref:hypothetical protein n=1 Tax=Enemella evansiae TaxID=2016499 RepID=UPI001061BFB2|nr:hypothetical protein [Enemella evansiae]TDO89824.1 hypothetical protein C8D81_2708 [Enemella evansiae]